MNLPNRYTNIQELYKSIKSDDLVAFKNKLILHPEYLEYSNKYGNTLFSYSLEKQASNISNYLLAHHINKILTDNTFQYDILKYLVNKNNNIGLAQLFSLLTEKELNLLYSLDREEPLIFLAVKKLDKINWNLFIHYCEKFITQNELSYISPNGLNIAHIIAVHNQSYCLHILKSAPKNLFYDANNHLDSTPLLLAAKYSNPDILNFLLNESDITHTNFSNDNITHISCLNKDINTFNLLLQKNIGVTDKNINNHTPFMLSILEKSEEKSLALFSHYLTHDISDELFEASRSFNNLETFFFNIIEHITEKNINELRQNPAKVSAFFSSIFYYCNGISLDKLKNSHLWTLFETIKDDPYYIHQIYVSTIMNRKHMVKKINLLLENHDILHANNTEMYYTPLIEKNGLIFKSIYTKDNTQTKLQKSFCFIAGLGTLPIGQIKDILENSNVLKNLTTYDLLLLFSIGLKKQSAYIINIVIHKYNEISNTNITMESNYDIAIQNNLSNYNFNPQYNIYYKKILRHFQHIPINLLNNISYNLMQEEQTILDLTNIMDLFNETISCKKQIISSVISNLLQTDNPNKNFLSIFYKKPTLLFFVFKSLIIKNPNFIKNNELFTYITTHSEFNHTAKNWKLIFNLANSNNLNKELLIKNLLPTVKMEELSDFNTFKEELSKYTIDCNCWHIILNHIHQSEFFQSILNEYLNDISSQNIITNNIFEEITINSIDTSIIDTTILMTNVIKNHTNDTSLFFQELFLTNNDTNKLISICLEYSNFLYLEQLISQQHISLIDIPLENFWINYNMTQVFELNFIQNKHQSTNDFLNFIEQHLENINSSNLNNILNGFLTWYSTSNVNHQTKILITTSLLSTLDKKSHLIEEDLFIRLSTTILDDISHQTLIVKNNDNTNVIFNLIFKNKSDVFFKTLLNNKQFIENQQFLSNDNQKLIHYYSLINIIPNHDADLVKSRSKI